VAEVVLSLTYTDEQIARQDARFLSDLVNKLMQYDAAAQSWSLTLDGLEFMPSPREFHGVSPETVRTLLERRSQRADEGH
jgi:hypothetical protein